MSIISRFNHYNIKLNQVYRTKDRKIMIMQHRDSDRTIIINKNLKFNDLRINSDIKLSNVYQP